MPSRDIPGSITDMAHYDFSDTPDGVPYFNFIKTYSGWLHGYCKQNISSKVDLLMLHYGKMQFTELNKQLHYLYTNSAVFFTKDDCKETIRIFNKLLYIKGWFYKYIKKSTLKTPLLVNNIDLQLEEFKDSDKNVVTINCNKLVYTFRISELLSIYRHSTTNLDYDIPKPLLPMNPYTNEQFTLKQHYIIYDKLLDYYCGLRRTLPEHYILFKNSYFDTELFYKKYYVFLMYKTIRTTVKNMTLIEWLSEMDRLCGGLDSHCKICFNKLKNVRTIFKNVLELWLLNENDIWIFGCGLNEYNRIAKSNKQHFQQTHYITHRLIKRAGKSIHSINSHTVSTMNRFLTNFI